MCAGVLMRVVVASLLLAGSLCAAVYDDAIVSRVHNVYDGDTITVDIYGYPSVVGSKIGVRVAGIDTPEIHGKCVAEKKLAVKAKSYVATVVGKGKSVVLKNVQRDKYFRLLADVYVDGISISELMISNGMARPYDGGTKSSWCQRKEVIK